MLAVIATIVFTVGLLSRPFFVAVTDVDDALLGALERIRFGALTTVMERVDGVGTSWLVRAVAWMTIVALAVNRRFRSLAVYLMVLVAGTGGALLMTAAVGRLRPTAVPILGHWEGYAYPARPVVAVTLVVVGVVYTLTPVGSWRGRAKVCAALVIGIFSLARLYLAVDHPTDVLAALAIGWAMPVIAFRSIIPEEVFPPALRRAKPAHIDVGGRRGAAIVTALDHQLGLTVDRLEPFGLAGSSGSTPIRLWITGDDGTTTPLFGKLYALNHLRADRWYKWARTIAYGRLEDEKPFSTVRRLAEYEDHMLRLFRDAGLPSPVPFGFVEITPEREYVIVMEFFEGAREIDATTIDAGVIDDALAAVRRLWDAGVAHRDIKPSNLLVRDGHVLLIDVAFATVRPSPWRQAVDLANMMLTLALCTTAELVYERALLQFDPDDIAEAFAASHSITIPTQLRGRLREDGRGLVAEFRRLAPEREEIPVQLWSMRRVAVTAGAVLLALLGLGLAAAYVQVAGLV